MIARSSSNNLTTPPARFADLAARMGASSRVLAVLTEYSIRAGVTGEIR